MQHSFIQKLILTVVAAFFFAGLIWIYQHVVVGANESLNNKRTHIENVVR